MQDYNGSSLGLAVILGELRADSRHLNTAVERQNEILLDINDTLRDLPSQIAMTISPASASRQRTTIGSIAKITVAAKEIMPPLKEIISALIILAATLGWIVPQPKPHGSTPQTQSAE
jgi:hypothetical protein